MPAAGDFSSLDSPSMRFLPRQQEAEGWTLEDDPLVIPPAHLRERIGSDAEHFLLYEIVDLTVGEYRGADGRSFATVEIFRFPDFIKAFGAYTSRRPAGSAAVDIANEAYAGPRSVHVWRGPFYVRVIGGGGPGAASALAALAAASTAEMPPAPGVPAVFRFFPDSNRIPRTEMFNAREAFGQPALRNAFTADFNMHGKTVSGLILPTTNRETAAAVLANYRGFFVVNGRVLDPIPNLGEGNFTGEDRNVGRTIAFRIDRFVIAFRGFVPREALLEIAIATDQRILASIRSQLQLEERVALQTAAAANAPPSEAAAPAGPANTEAQPPPAETQPQN